MNSRTCGLILLRLLFLITNIGLGVGIVVAPIYGPPLIMTLFTISVVMIIIQLICGATNSTKKHDFIEKRIRIAGMIPCYNESAEELKRTIDSFKALDLPECYRLTLFVICDGRIGPKDNWVEVTALKLLPRFTHAFVRVSFS